MINISTARSPPRGSIVINTVPVITDWKEARTLHKVSSSCPFIRGNCIVCGSPRSWTITCGVFLSARSLCAKLLWKCFTLYNQESLRVHKHIFVWVSVSFSFAVTWIRKKRTCLSHILNEVTPPSLRSSEEDQFSRTTLGNWESPAWPLTSKAPVGYAAGTHL